jgi:hypothetical protein
MLRIANNARNGLRKIGHLICYQDGRFGSNPRWRFFIFNILVRRKASAAARFYVSKASGLKDLSQS